MACGKSSRSLARPVISARERSSFLPASAVRNTPTWCGFCGPPEFRRTKQSWPRKTLFPSPNWTGGGVFFPRPFAGIATNTKSSSSGAAVVGHWVWPTGKNNADRDEWIKVEGSQLRPRGGYLSLRFGEPMEEVNYIDQVRLVAIDHPAATDVYPNERFLNEPPFADGRAVLSANAHPLSGAWDDQGRD